MKENKKEKNRTKVLMLMTVLTAILLIASTYAWFSVNKSVNINGIEAKVSAAEGLKISLDAENWTSSLKVNETELATAATKTSTDGKPANNYSWVSTEGLKPVSVAGDQYDDGSDVYVVQGKLDETETKLEDTQTVEANGDYIVFDLYIKNTAKINTKDTLKIGANSTVVAGVLNTGLESSVRLGMLLYGGKNSNETMLGDLTTTSADIRDLASSAGTSRFTIWEPNSDSHASSSGITGSKTTYAIKHTAVGTIAGIKNGATDTNNFKAPTTTATESGGITSAEILLDAEGSGNVELLANKIYKARVYIWLEGQDDDCVDLATAGQKLTFDFNLTKE